MANAVIPAKAGSPATLYRHSGESRNPASLCVAQSWTPTFVGVTSIQSPGMTNFQTIMAGLDPAISRKQ
jgi:hypothetical protein